MSKSVMIIDTPSDCCECPFGTIVFGKDVCLLCEGNGIDCPLKPYKDSIPIEWIEEYTKRLVIKRRFLAENGYRDNRCYDYMFGIIGMLDDWDKEIREKENEGNQT